MYYLLLAHYESLIMRERFKVWELPWTTVRIGSMRARVSQGFLI